jgi:hypothetical protein
VGWGERASAFHWLRSRRGIACASSCAVMSMNCRSDCCCVSVSCDSAGSVLPLLVGEDIWRVAVGRGGVVLVVVVVGCSLG